MGANDAFPLLISLLAVQRGQQRELFRQKGYLDVTNDLQKRCLSYVGDRAQFLRICEHKGWLPKGTATFAEQHTDWVEKSCLAAFFHKGKQHYVLHGTGLQFELLSFVCLAFNDEDAQKQMRAAHPVTNLYSCRKVDDSQYIHQIDLNRAVESAVITKPYAEVLTKDGHLSLSLYGRHIGLSDRAIARIQHANGHIDVAIRGLEQQLAVVTGSHGKALYSTLLGELRQAVADGGLQQSKIVWRGAKSIWDRESHRTNHDRCNALTDGQGRETGRFS